MRLLFLLSLVLVVSCGKAPSGANFGTTTVTELTTLKGEPLKEEVIPIVGGKVLHYADNEKFQIQGEVVTHQFIDPKADEANLIYWKHAFKDCSSSNIKTSEKSDGHTPAEYFFKCDAMGTGVIYTERSDKVTRIIKYEKK